MASIGRFRTNCLGDEWFNNGFIQRICPAPLTGYITDGGTGADRWLAINFAGRGKTDTYAACGFTDPYVTFSGGPNSSVDIWGAHRAGIWTSSVDIEYFLAADAAIAAANFELSAADLFSTIASRTLALPASVLGACPPTLHYTVTITDDGTISVSP